MSVRAYTTALADGMRVKHNAKARFTVTTGRTVLEDSLVDAEAIGGAITLAGFTYNRLSYSGGVAWWDPTTGQSIARPQWKVRLRPEDVLTGGQECDCGRCELEIQ